MMFGRPKDVYLSPWVAVLTMWFDGVIAVGILKALGILLPTLQEQFRLNAGVAGLIVSMVGAMGSLLGLFSVLFKRTFGVGISIIISGALIGTACVLASFATSAFQLAVILNLLLGTGMGVSSVLTKEGVAQSFQDNYSTAIGIARTGYSVGILASASLAQLVLSTYGWRGVLLLTGGISFNLSVCGSLLVTTKSPRNKYELLIKSDDLAPPPRESSCSPRCCALWRYVCINLELELLLDLRFTLVSVVYSLTLVVWSLWTIYFVSLVTSEGFSTGDAALFVTVGGVGSLFFKVLQGVYIDQTSLRHPGSLFIPHALVICLCASTFCLTPLATSYWGMMTTSFVFLSADGVLTCLNDILLKQTLELDKLAGAYGWIALQTSVLRFTFGFVPGLVYDASGSYSMAFMLIGGLYFFPLLAVITLHYSKN